VATGEAAKQAAVVQKAIEVTEQYERIAAAQRKAALTWRGFVTDGARGLPDAAVTFTNTASRRTASAETGQFGQYVINLETLGVSDDTILEVAVALANYRQSRDTIRFKDGIELRTFMKPR
jgi:hypothetical protein